MKRLFLISILFSSTISLAGERLEFYQGVRGLGMGGTQVAIVNDETALATNPAALGKLRDFYGTIIDPELDISGTVPDMQRASAFSQPFKIDDVMGSILTSQDTAYHARLQMLPSFVARNFGIGLFVNQTLNGISTSPTAVDLYSRNDLGLLLGYNLRLWDGRIKIGFTGKVINREELNETAFDPTAHALDESSLATAGFLKEGTGVGADVGIILTAPWTMLPTLAAVLHDVGNTAYDKSPGLRLAEATARPATVMQDLDVGLSVSPIHRNNVRSVWSIEYKGALTAKDETDKAKLLHFGTEFNFGDVFFLRAGYNQRYWTAGFELSSEHFQFQIASYGEEIGDSTAPREDRRYVMKTVYRY